MGRIVRLDNWCKNERVTSGVPRANVWLTDINGNLYNPFTNSSYNNYRHPFYVNDTGINFSTPGNNYPYPYACSDSTINASRYDLTNTFGAATIGFTRTATGWDANIQIVHNADATINSLLFACKDWFDSSSNQKTALYFAYILDSPITLNAENNYTANLTMSVSFE